MPVIFIGHGSPMNAISNNNFTAFLKQSVKDIPKPRAILMISAHWLTGGTKVLGLEDPKIIYDFGGFPDELYQVKYPARGSLEVTDRVLSLLHGHAVVSDASWGLDHGTWAVLKFMYPEADVPVLQLSLDTQLSLRQHFELGEKLKSLRDEGILIMGSGNIVHNLRLMNFDPAAPPYPWAQEFDLLIKAAILKKDMVTLFAENPEHRERWRMAHPSIDHYLPLLYVLGTSDEKDQVSFPYEEIQLGSMSMRAVRFG